MNIEQEQLKVGTWSIDWSVERIETYRFPGRSTNPVHTDHIASQVFRRPKLDVMKDKLK